MICSSPQGAAHWPRSADSRSFWLAGMCVQAACAGQGFPPVDPRSARPSRPAPHIPQAAPTRPAHRPSARPAGGMRAARPPRPPQPDQRHRRAAAPRSPRHPAASARTPVAWLPRPPGASARPGPVPSARAGGSARISITRCHRPAAAAAISDQPVPAPPAPPSADRSCRHQRGRAIAADGRFAHDPQPVGAVPSAARIGEIGQRILVQRHRSARSARAIGSAGRQQARSQ